MTDFDVIVIGSGHNGLTAAATLANASWKVAVVEKAELPGGASKSAEFTQKGFIHDLYATNIGSFLGGPLTENLVRNCMITAFLQYLPRKPFPMYPLTIR